MKTIELKWIEDDNHVVAKDAYNGLKELIDTGVFPDLTAKCEDDTLYITGEKEDLDKAVMKIQKAYAKYGQIMIKEAKNGVNQELRIESFDENVQDIFNHTLDDYNKFKSSKERPLNYVKQLNDYRFKFKKFYETASRSDKKLLKPYLDEISNLLDESEIVNKIKPIKKIDEGKLIDADALNVMMELIDLGYPSEAASKLIKKYTNFINQELKDGAKPFWIAKLIEDDMVNNKYSDRDDEEELVKESKEICEAAGKKVVNPENVDTIEDVEKELQELGYNEWQAKGLVKEYFKKAWRKLASGECAMNVAIDIDEEYMKESVDNELTKHLGNLKNWGIIEESMTRKQYNAKYDKVALAYARETGMDLDDAYDELMDVDELVNWIEGPYDVDEIVDKLMNESTTMNESFDWDTVVEPLELSKTIKEINSRMNLSNIIDITSNHNSIFVNTDPFTYTIHLNKKYLWIEKSDVTVYKQKLDNGKVTKSDLVDVLSFINTDVRDMKRNVEESTINESWLSPAELKKKLQRVAMKWASEEGIKYEIAYNDLRKRKSVKDMLDFYTVDEIIDDLKKKKKEVDDELEEEI